MPGAPPTASATATGTLNLQHSDIDPGFRADLGFFGQVGYDKSVAGAGYTWYRDGKSINRINMYGDWDITHRFDGQLLERELEFNVNFQGPKQSSFSFGPLTRVRFWNGAMFREHNLHFDGNFRLNRRPAVGHLHELRPAARLARITHRAARR